jgi:hypothetical protein
MLIGVSDRSLIRTITVESWPQLMDEVYQESWDEQLGRHRSPFVFRGICDARADLSTSLMRLGDAAYPDLAKLESHLLRNFRKYAHSAGAEMGKSVWNWLALAQHHGLHTRLLDWTYSPLVAAHFATDTLATFGLDGAIWCVNHRKTLELLPEALKEVAEPQGVDVFTAEMLDEVAGSLEAFDALSDKEFAVFMEPPSLDERIVNQFALFSLVSNASRKFDDWLADHPDIAKKIVIPAGLKWELRDKLDQAGITERVLLPGLDGLSRWLSRYYTPKSKFAPRNEPDCPESE